MKTGLLLGYYCFVDLVSILFIVAIIAGFSKNSAERFAHVEERLSRGESLLRKDWSSWVWLVSRTFFIKPLRTRSKSGRVLLLICFLILFFEASWSAIDLIGDVIR
ncbi:MAG: hypothetical protein ACRES7_08105 [Gammaproteobacteria bacterium]